MMRESDNTSFALPIDLTRTRHALYGLILFLLGPSSWALDLNLATEAELDGLKGMGPSLSRKVLAAREIRTFTDWADFRQRVSGIGIAKVRQFSEQGLTVAGQVFSEAPPPAKDQTLP